MLAATSLLSMAAPLAPAPAASHAAASQLLVLGMHHSGTSVVSNLTMMMGAYGGETNELLLHPENPLKFWERRDVVALDEHRLVAGVQEKVASRYETPEWVAYGFDGAKGASKIHEQAEARAIVDKLNVRRPWVTKDPRMCLVADEWMQLLDAPVCLIVHREPLSVANSMMIYSHNVSLAEWASVYEAYYSSAMRACHGVRADFPPHDGNSRMNSSHNQAVGVAAAPLPPAPCPPPPPPPAAPSAAPPAPQPPAPPPPPAPVATLGAICDARVPQSSRAPAPARPLPRPRSCSPRALARRPPPQ
jgi:hypothetical protein